MWLLYLYEVAIMKMFRLSKIQSHNDIKLNVGNASIRSVGMLIRVRWKVFICRVRSICTIRIIQFNERRDYAN